MNKISYIFVLFLSIFLFNSILYAYTSYSIGDEVTYNDIKFYVIKDSSSEENTVTLLKATPLSSSEINLYGEGHVNKYTWEYHNVANDNLDYYGGVAFYSSEECGFVNNTWVLDNCILNYELSDVKYIVDAWGNSVIEPNDIAIDSTGYGVRLITFEEYRNNIEYGDPYYNYYYWTMSFENGILYAGYTTNVYPPAYVTTTGVYNEDYALRPVITLKKIALGDEDETINNVSDVENKDDLKKEIEKNNEEVKSSYVTVPNTLQKVSIIFIMIGVIFVSISIIIVIKNRK